MERKQLLIVEDEPAHADLIAMGFRGTTEWSLHFTTTLEQAQERLDVSAFDLVLADLNLPDGLATELCSASPAVVIMTVQGDEERAVSALRKGALDYVVKDAPTLRSMPAVVRRAHRRSTLLQAQQRAERDLQAKQQELERNNRRLEQVLESARALTRIEDPREAERFIVHVVRRELNATVEIQELPEAELQSVELVQPGLIRAALTAAGGASMLEFSRAEAFDTAELALVRMAMDLVRETVRGIEAQRALRRTEQRLHQADKLRSVGQLAGGIAHDFNNMLTAIMSSTEVLRLDLLDEGASPDHIEQLDLVLEVSQHAAQLTRQLLTFSRGGSRVRSAVRVRKTLQQLSGILSHSLSDGISLEILSCEDLYVHCDPSLLQTALLNLCLNARDAMPSGGRIELACRQVTLDPLFVLDHLGSDHSGPFVEFAVQDQGQGMDPETQRRIFEPFFTTKQAGRATGLGLAVVFGTFTDANGGVLVESTLGHGSTFRAYLPLLQNGPQHSNAPEAPLGSKPLDVLVVDDNQGVLRTSQLLLERLGHTVHSCQDPRVALERIGERHFDLLLLDIVMPAMGGVELADKVLQDGFGGAIVLMSGYSEEHDGLIRLRKDHEVLFLQKPFTRQDLDQSIASLRETGRLPLATERHKGPG